MIFTLLFDQLSCDLVLSSHFVNRAAIVSSGKESAPGQQSCCSDTVWFPFASGIVVPKVQSVTNYHDFTRDVLKVRVDNLHYECNLLPPLAVMRVQDTNMRASRRGRGYTPPDQWFLPSPWSCTWSFRLRFLKTTPPSITRSPTLGASRHGSKFSSMLTPASWRVH